jgi:hypothetical protein
LDDRPAPVIYDPAATIENARIESQYPNMDFELTQAQHEIMGGVCALCARFPDSY